ncbi:MAG: DNA methyltransferase, partial [Promethearchaeota archaeon]
MIDTKFFDEEFKYRVLSELNDLDGKINGILINSDNFHALRLLNCKYKGKIDCCYIDPPYNTESDGLLYKDNFEDSSWLSMIHDRLLCFRPLLKEDGVFFSSIDDNMLISYSKLVGSIFKEKLKNIIWHKKTQPSFLTKEIIPVTEYIIGAKQTDRKLELLGGFGNPDKITEMINISNKIGVRVLPKESVYIKNGWSGVLKSKTYGKDKLEVSLLNGPIKVINGKPTQDLKLKGRFKWSQERINEEVRKGGQIYIKTLKSLRPTIKRVFNDPIIKAPITLLSKKLNPDIPTNTDGNKEMKELFKITPFDYSKPTGLIKYLFRSVIYNRKNSTVIDFFAGSGTSGDAILQLNKEEGY